MSAISIKNHFVQQQEHEGECEREDEQTTNV